MAATVQAEPLSAAGVPSPRVISVTGDASYATGGYLVSGSLFGAAGAPSDGAQGFGIDTGGTVIAQYDQTNKKVKFITRATGAEVANASNQSGVTVKILLYG